MTWKTIETAPFLEPLLIAWCPARIGAMGVDVATQVRHPDGIVWSSADGMEWDGDETPTHWMPLPEPPR